MSKGPYYTWRTAATVGTEMVRVRTERCDGRVVSTDVYLMNTAGQRVLHSRHKRGFLTDNVSDNTAVAVAGLRAWLRSGGTTAKALAQAKAARQEQIQKAKAIARRVIGKRD